MVRILSNAGDIETFRFKSRSGKSLEEACPFIPSILAWESMDTEAWPLRLWTHQLQRADAESDLAHAHDCKVLFLELTMIL